MNYLRTIFIMALSLSALGCIGAPSVTMGTVTHMTVGCSSGSVTYTNGAIDIDVRGKSPISYSWTGPGGFTASTQDISGLTAAGEYVVQVTDATGSASLRISVGYENEWSYFGGTEEVLSGGKPALKNVSGSNNWCRGAGSQNILPGGTDGWIEYKATVTNQHKIFGFSEYLETSHCWGYMDYGVYLKNNGTMNRVISGAQVYIGTYAVGDLIRVSREGTNFRIYKNGTQLTSYNIGTSGQNKDFTTWASIWTNGGMLENVGCSFKPPMEVDIDVTNIECGETDNGSIDLDPCGSGYTYAWDHGPTTASISDLSEGTYGVTITDGNGWMVKKFISVGYDVNWINENNVSITNNVVNKDAGGAAWNAGANSDNVLMGNQDGWIEYEVVETNTERAFGWTENPVSTHPLTSIDYGINFHAAGNFHRTVSGTVNAIMGTLKVGDIVRVHREGSRVNYYINNYLRTYTNVTASEELFAEVALYTQNGNFENVRYSIPCIKGPFFTLKEQIDGSCYIPKNNTLYLHYEEDYDPNATALTFTIKDDASNTYSYSPSLIRNEGENYFEIDLGSVTPTLTTGYYTLEVTNDKNETTYLRFKI